MRPPARWTASPSSAYRFPSPNPVQALHVARLHTFTSWSWLPDRLKLTPISRAVVLIRAVICAVSQRYVSCVTAKSPFRTVVSLGGAGGAGSNAQRPNHHHCGAPPQHHHGCRQDCGHAGKPQRPISCPTVLNLSACHQKRPTWRVGALGGAVSSLCACCLDGKEDYRPHCPLLGRSIQRWLTVAAW